LLAIFSLALARRAEAGIALALFVVLFRRRRDARRFGLAGPWREADQPPIVDDAIGEDAPPETALAALASVGHSAQAAASERGPSSSAAASADTGRRGRHPRREERPHAR